MKQRSGFALHSDRSGIGRPQCEKCELGLTVRSTCTPVWSPLPHHVHHNQNLEYHHHHPCVPRLPSMGRLLLYVGSGFRAALISPVMTTTTIITLNSITPISMVFINIARREREAHDDIVASTATSRHNTSRRPSPLLIVRSLSIV